MQTFEAKIHNPVNLPIKTSSIQNDKSGKLYTVEHIVLSSHH